MGRSWVLTAGFLAMVASPVFAADMPLKAPPPPAPLDQGWNGTYVGAFVGWERATSDWDPTCIQFGGPFTCGTPGNLTFFPGAPDSRASFNNSSTRYGLYTGWMFEVSNRWVFGAESDFAFHSKTASVPAIVGCATAVCTGGAFGPGPFTGDSTSLKLGDDYSMRVRAGFLLLPQLQLYVAGGPAAQKVTATVLCSNTGANGCFPTLLQTSSTTLVGYTVGAGLEWKVLDHILLRGEYRYNDYGTWKQNAFIGSGQIEEFANIHVKSQMATVGIAYLFPPPHW
ncbi:MAG TPA: outer membrane beta-barrel protein [Xanthobacteraceae bacterium]|jgi:outer membrane immunogenic protein